LAKASEAFGELAGLRRLAIAATEAGRPEEARPAYHDARDEGNNLGEGAVGTKLRSEVEQLPAAPKMPLRSPWSPRQQAASP
jgi:hypothetical protein